MGLRRINAVVTAFPNERACQNTACGLGIFRDDPAVARKILFKLGILVFCLVPAHAADVISGTTWPFVHPEDHFGSDALLDLRSLNEAAAGETGFVRISKDGGFVRGDGSPLRFWACGRQEYKKRAR